MTDEPKPIRRILMAGADSPTTWVEGVESLERDRKVERWLDRLMAVPPPIRDQETDDDE